MTMLAPYIKFFLFSLALSLSTFTYASQEQAPPSFAYYTLEPELTTNFYTTGKQLGYIRVRIDIMVAQSSHIPILEVHEPLIRNIIIDLLGQQDESTVKSLPGREQIRKSLIDELNNALLAETGQTLVADLLFTKYLYQ